MGAVERRLIDDEVFLAAISEPDNEVAGDAEVTNELYGSE